MRPSVYLPRVIIHPLYGAYSGQQARDPPAVSKQFCKIRVSMFWSFMTADDLSLKVSITAFDKSASDVAYSSDSVDR